MAPEHRGRGIGRQLLGWGVARARSSARPSATTTCRGTSASVAYDSLEDRHRLLCQVRLRGRPLERRRCTASLDDLPEVPCPRRLRPRAVARRPRRGVAVRCATPPSPTTRGRRWSSPARGSEFLRGHGSRPDLSVIAVDTGTSVVVGVCINQHYPEDEAVTGAARRAGSPTSEPCVMREAAAWRRRCCSGRCTPSPLRPVPRHPRRRHRQPHRRGPALPQPRLRAAPPVDHVRDSAVVEERRVEADERLLARRSAARLDRLGRQVVGLRRRAEPLREVAPAVVALEEEAAGVARSPTAAAGATRRRRTARRRPPSRGSARTPWPFHSRSSSSSRSRGGAWPDVWLPGITPVGPASSGQSCR